MEGRKQEDRRGRLTSTRGWRPRREDGGRRRRVGGAVVAARCGLVLAATSGREPGEDRPSARRPTGIIRILLILVLLSVPGLVRAAWYNTQWQYRKPITIDAGKVAGDLSDFPVLINLPSDSDLQTDAQGDGDDILFTASDGTTKLSHEIERYVAGNGGLVAWVKVPDLSSTVNTDLYLYYGNPTCGSQEDVASVWTSGFVGVWHLHEEQAGTGNAGLYLDSSPEGNHGDDYITSTGQNGRIGNGHQFSGNADWIQVPHDATLNLTGAMTISFWIYPTEASSTWNRIVEKGLYGFQTSYYFGCGNGTNDLTFYLNNTEVFDTANGLLTVGSWQHAAVTYDSAGNAALYLNGAPAGAGTYTGAIPGNTEVLYISFPNSTYDFAGYVDEIHIADTNLPADWITTEHANQSDPAGFFALGGEETLSSVSGRVFEDVNYGGGAGRSWAAVSGSGGALRSAARVELFDNSGAYVTATTTDGSGNYSFPGLAPGDYVVRVVTSSVTSSRSGYVAGLLPVQSFRTDASSGTAVDVTNYVGGHDPATADAGDAAAGWILNPSTGVFSGGGSGKAHAFALVKVSSANVTGVDFGWNFDTIVNTNDAGQGSLRQFLTNANTLGGDASLAQSGLVAAKENAVFMISNGTAAAGLRAANSYFAGGVATISPTSALPTISAALVLDAQKQPGWTGAPIIELDGSSAGAGSAGLAITGGSSIVRGLVINRFGDAGVNVTTNGSNTVAGNYIGVNAAGTAASPNGSDGIILTGVTGNTVGGTTASDRNVISGNNNASNNSDGIWISGGSGNIVRGNYLGTNAAGSAPIPNYNGGVTITGSSNNLVGGAIAGAANLISGNGRAGVIVASGTGNGVLSNSIYGNTTIGIDLANDGVTTNNGTKNGGLPNSGMDHPVFTSAELQGNALTVSGYVGSAPNQSTFANARVEVFESDNDGSGFGEGKTYLGFLTSDASGNFAGAIDVTGKGLLVGEKVTGTATDGSNNTSEFGANVTVGFAVSGRVFEDVNYGGGAGRSWATVSGSGGSVRSTARVELFDNAGLFLSATTTDGSGGYSFAGLVPGTYLARVVTSSVTSSRSGYVATLRPVMTYRTDASGGTAADVTNYVGGHDPATADAGNAGVGWALDSSTGVFSGSGSGKAHAFAPVTISAANVTGVDFGWNFDTIVNINNTGQGSLRQAITNANTLTGDASLAQSGLVAGKENAVFMISNGTAAAGLRAANNYFSAGLATIVPSSAMTTINAPLVLDAQKQPGWTTAPIILLDGNNLAANGLVLSGTADGSVVRGFIVRDFGTDGIRIQAGSDNNTIAGNYVGRLNGSGTNAGAGEANGVYGLRVLGSTNTIGGTSATTRNVISGNTDNGIYVSTGSSNVITGNYVGTTAAGNVALGNSSEGVEINGASGTRFGGVAPNAGNVVAASGQEGIWIINGATGSIIQGNWIGTDPTGTVNLGNAEGGIRIGNSNAPASNNLIGGTTAGAANVIAFNTRSGVGIDQNLSGASVGNAVLGNSIYSNVDLAIDLDDLYADPSSPGVTANDANDGDTGGNNRQNFPVLTSAGTTGTQLTVIGSLNSTANSYFRIEFFANAAQDGSGYGEGQTYLGSANVTTNGSGDATVNTTLTVSVTPGSFITATATKSDATFTTFTDTSEFAANVVATSPTTTLATGTDPGNASLPPGGAATMADAFTIQTNTGTDAIAAVVVTLAAGTSGGLSLIEITNDAGTVVHGSVSDPASDTPSISLTTSITAATTLTQYKIRITPKSHANMPAPPGSTYGVTAYISNWTGTNGHAGSDAGGTTVTIDNLSPGNVTASTATAGDSQVSLSWTNPGDADLGSIIVLRRAGSAVGDNPAEGATYVVGNTIGSSTVACVVAAPGTSCIDSGLTNGTACHYKIFAQDTNGNYATGVVPTGSPATPFGLYAISGKVFEDVNYGGGAGRNWATVSGSGGSLRSGARVELFDNAGAYVTTRTTDGSGDYSLTGVTAGSYLVRVVTSSVTSSRSGYVAGLLPIMTFRTDASSGTAADVTDYVGGHDPATADAGNAAAGWILNSGTGVFTGGGSGMAHAFAPVTVGAANVTGLDFGWNFDAVTNTNNTGQGSLRQFLTNANTLAGDVSLAQSGLVAAIENAVFMISNGTAAAGLRAANDYFSGGVATISPTSALPPISTPMVIDAQRQPGWTLPPIVELNGSGAGAGVSGLAVTGGGSTLRGLVVNRFDGDGIRLATAPGNAVAASYVGTDATGTIDRGNGESGIGIDASANNRIGGSVTERNILSGNGLYGVGVLDSSATGNVIAGNYIGVDVTGSADLGNASAGVFISGTGNTVGGDEPGERNVISGNDGYGVVTDTGANGGGGNIIIGNFVGTDHTGTAAIGNRFNGLFLGGNANRVGGTASGEGNVISGHSDIGVRLDGATNTVVQGNRIGTDVSGSVALPNLVGLRLAFGTIGTQVGGASSQARNVISGNAGAGVRLDQAATQDNIVEGNYIGTDASGAGLVPNGGAGIAIDAATDNRIGGTAAGAGNTLRGNDFGVEVVGGAIGNAIIGNAIHENNGLGIDLEADGNTPNDGGDGDAGSNDLLNFPVLTSAVAAGGQVTVDFELDVPAGSYRVELFRNPSGADPSGYGEGEVFLGAVNVDHAGGGAESFRHTVAGVVGDTITATTTECTDGATCLAFGSSSEFSAPIAAGPLAIVKRAFLTDGTPLPDAALVPRGTLVKYLLYVSNPGGAVTDVSLTDVLDPGFAYLPGTIRYSGSLDACALNDCTAGEELAIYAAANAGTAGTDAVDGDVVSFVGTTLDAGDQGQANARLDLAAGKIFAVVFTVKVQ